MAGLTPAQKQQYDEQGYVVFRQLLVPEELQPLIDDISAEVDQRARAYYAKGQVKSLYAEHGFETRLAKLWAECEAIHQHWVGGRHAGPGLFSLLTHPKLLDIAESIVGPEVHCQGRHRLRPKVPDWDQVTVPWHDDTPFGGRRIIYFREPYGSDARDPHYRPTAVSRVLPMTQPPEPGFWLPLVEANEANGCLRLLPGGHRHAPPTASAWTPEKVVTELDGLETVSLPMQVGDALLFHQHLPHHSPFNGSDHIRWSVDIRYQDGNQRVKSAREPGFLARSKERPQDVVTTFDGYRRIRDAVREFMEQTGLRL